MAASNGRVEKGVPTGLVPEGLAARVDATFSGESTREKIALIAFFIGQ